ncbi:hypothetical protein AB9P05_01255 [Roseivirga sp. BDSF3-8]|uniref:hypothetical protein n=1 Tax=Roseivirga sp. BDSF3-8 TaxID=3241598 RepID=UPI003531B227
MQKTLLKPLALTLFICLIGGFVAYNAGYITGRKIILLGNPNGGTTPAGFEWTGERADSIKEEFDNKMMKALGSTKVLIIKPDQERNFLLDSLYLAIPDSLKDND